MNIQFRRRLMPLTSHTTTNFQNSFIITNKKWSNPIWHISVTQNLQLMISTDKLYNHMSWINYQNFNRIHRLTKIIQTKKIQRHSTPWTWHSTPCTCYIGAQCSSYSAQQFRVSILLSQWNLTVATQLSTVPRHSKAHILLF